MLIFSIFIVLTSSRVYFPFLLFNKWLSERFDKLTVSPVELLSVSQIYGNKKNSPFF